MIRIQNTFGEVSIAETAIARVVAETARDPEFRGKFFFASPTGKIVKIGGTGREALSFIDVDEGEDGKVNIHIYAVIKFGTSIKAVTEELGRRIRINVPMVTGCEVDHLLLSVTGMKSKKIARRELEISL